MTLKLQINLEGPAPDLGDGTQGVSLRFFAEFAKVLRDAYQRSAQAVLTGTAQDTGRLPIRATEVDIRLVDVRVASLHMDLVPTDLAVQATLGPALASEALDRLMSDLDSVRRDPERSDIPRAIRSLVAVVPGDVRQRYVLSSGGVVVREVEMTSNGIEAAPSGASATVDRVAATVRSVVFLPRPQVVLDTHDGRVQALATPQLLEKAWALRDATDVVAVIVRNSSGARLLGIRQAAAQGPATPTTEETLARFAGVLRLLAR